MMKRNAVEHCENLYRTFPWVFWKKCSNCTNEFVLEWGWRHYDKKGNVRYLCRTCAQKRGDADIFFNKLVQREKRQALLRSWKDCCPFCERAGMEEQVGLKEKTLATYKELLALSKEEIPEKIDVCILRCPYCKQGFLLLRVEDDNSG